MRFPQPPELPGIGKATLFGHLLHRVTGMSEQRLRTLQPDPGAIILNTDPCMNPEQSRQMPLGHMHPGRKIGYGTSFLRMLQDMILYLMDGRVDMGPEIQIHASL